MGIWFFGTVQLLPKTAGFPNKVTFAFSSPTPKNQAIQLICSNFRILRNDRHRTSLVVQWLRLHAPNIGVWGSISGQGTRSHMPQQRLKTPCTTTKIWNSQINIFFFFLKKEIRDMQKPSSRVRGSRYCNCTSMSLYVKVSIY